MYSLCLRLNQNRLKIRIIRLARHSVLLFFVGFFAFVLPFLCWGQMGTPGHPHLHAHFIFQWETPAWTSHTQEASTHDLGTHHHHHHHHHRHDHPLEGQRSFAEFSLITLLLVIFFGLWFTSLAPRPFSEWGNADLFSRFPAPDVPVPPPKLCFASPMHSHHSAASGR